MVTIIDLSEWLAMSVKKGLIKMSNIKTIYNPKPIPTNSFDWEAIEDDYEPNRPIGYGKTEQEAKDDLQEQLSMLEDEASSEINDDVEQYPLYS